MHKCGTRCRQVPSVYLSVPLVYCIATATDVAKHFSTCRFSSVQFAKINVVLSAKHALQDHDTVISVTDAVVAGKEMFSGVAGMRTEMVRR